MEECYKSLNVALPGHKTKQDGMNDSATSNGAPLGPFANNLR